MPMHFFLKSNMFSLYLSKYLCYNYYVYYIYFL